MEALCKELRQDTSYTQATLSLIAAAQHHSGSLQQQASRAFSHHRTGYDQVQQLCQRLRTADTGH